jgi:hypothetical protein
MKSMRNLSCLPALLALFFIFGALNAEQKTENLILITLDGVRTEEMFHGIDLELLRIHAKKKPVEETKLYQNFWAETPLERREKLMPFFWTVWMSEQGSIAGDRWNGSRVELTNQHRFSYPGYSEILTGQAQDELINSNASIQNPFPTVLEFLKFKLKVQQLAIASFASWSVMDNIAESEAGTIFSNAGYEHFDSPDPDVQLMDDLQFETVSPWDTVRHDVYTFRFAMHYLKQNHPRVLYIALGETDDWAHEDRYDRVVQSIHRSDGYFRELWNFLQSEIQYQNKTTILITTDHGRGTQVDDWTRHKSNIEGSQYTWIAVVGPDHSLRGIWADAETVYTDQIAASLSAFLGFDYSEWNTEAGKPIAQFLD